MSGGRRPASRAAAAAAVLLLLLLALLTATVMNGATQGLDEAVNRALQPLRLPALVTAARWASRLAAPLVCLGLVLAASAWFWRARRRALLLPLWVLAFGVPASMEALKAFADRPRPEALLGLTASGASFPSGTTVFAAALYGFLACLLAGALNSDSQRRLLALAAALLVLLIAFSRLLLSVHYLTDVAAGLLLGAAWACFGLWLAGKGALDP